MRHPRIRYERQRDYPISPSEAWRLLADTDHLNRSIGLPAVDFSPMDGARGKVVREARSRAFGLIPVRWREYPFEWVRERRYVVRREFETGPVAVIEGGIELTPIDAGVRVKAYAEFTPANLSGRVLWRLGARSVDDTAAYCERYLERKADGEVDPTPVPERRPRLDRVQLESLMEQLRRSTMRPELLRWLERTLLEGGDDQLYRVRPYAVADAWGVDRLEVLRLFLHAARLGLFELRWELMCPICRVPKAESQRLAELPTRYHCDSCGIDYATEFDERVELRFSVHPSVRRVAGQVYCVGGPLRTPHIVAQQYLRPNEARRLDISVARALRLRAVGGARHLRLTPTPETRWSSEVSLIYADGRWTGPHSLATGDDSLAIPSSASLDLRNQTAGPLLVVLEDLDWTSQATTAAEVTTLPEFQQLFKSEMLAPGQEITVKEVALVASALRPSASLFDAAAAGTEKSRRASHVEFITEQAMQSRGVIVQVDGQTVTAAFYRIGDAIACASGAQRLVVAWSDSRGIAPPLQLGMGVHVGPVTALNGDERLEYFGRTVDAAGELAAEAQDGDILLLRRVFDQAKASLPREVESWSADQPAAPLRPGLASEPLIRLAAKVGAAAT